jgi:hypothetical protein
MANPQYVVTISFHENQKKAPHGKRKVEILRVQLVMSGSDTTPLKLLHDFVVVTKRGFR